MAAIMFDTHAFVKELTQAAEKAADALPISQHLWPTYCWSAAPYSLIALNYRRINKIQE